jgi:hypothetical protein
VSPEGLLRPACGMLGYRCVLIEASPGETRRSPSDLQRAFDVGYGMPSEPDHAVAELDRNPAVSSNTAALTGEI